MGSQKALARVLACKGGDLASPSLRSGSLGTLVTWVVTSTALPPTQVKATAAPSFLGYFELAGAAIESETQRLVINLSHCTIGHRHGSTGRLALLSFPLAFAFTFVLVRAAWVQAFSGDWKALGARASG